MPSCRVLIVDERRMLAAGLALVLEARPAITEVQVLQDLTSLPMVVGKDWTVVLTSETYASHVLRIAPESTRVLVVVQQSDVTSLARLLREGAAGACTDSDLPEDVAAAVEQVANGEMRLPSHLVPEVVAELQRLRKQAHDADALLAQLTQRERDVLAGLGQGRGRTEIARDLGLSPHTVRTHVQHLLHKLQLHSQLEAAAFARELVAALAPAARFTEGTPTVIDLDQHKDRRDSSSRS